MGIKVLSCFDGISCGMVALERAGIKADRYVAYEIDKNAIKISQHNYPNIEHMGDVTTADFTQYKGFDLLIGGSPCTYWSICQSKEKRETMSSGLGWDLFSQYLRALKETKPKYFLYENNKSMSKDIKNEITKQLGVEPVYINSNLVSAQNRPRLYWTNIPNVRQPKDRNILLKDVIDFSENEFRVMSNWVYGKRSGKLRLDCLATVDSKKASCLTTSKTHNEQYYANADKTLYTNLSVKQYELLQTLPVGYVDKVDVKETNKYKGIGNGWTVDVIAHIFKYMEV